ncbi:ABC transporter substrate-binding protein [Candidatus Methylomirabilis lanthanidiphila]|uniref:1,4-dihydroxy-6-naphtoate synthase n=1 Tax=Candidatus Methylomirabilis lanthanidiphila TaxID=2211376 RepID=A0A564ZHC9_9BACT|nr:ABC transporter substrate-binding protein [Candidatus Methylomirabilis lanthanidiphila]
METHLIRVGHSPDPDDAFMFYALAKERLHTGRYRFQHVLEAIDTLNSWALEGRLEVTALSVHAYAYVADRYILLPHGASIGRNYGPIVVAKQRLDPADLRGKRIAVPGKSTTAFLALRLYLSEFQAVDVPFDQVFDAVERGEADAALVIHEGQLTFEAAGFTKLLDLGAWWHELTGLPLPLGANAIRKDLGESCCLEVSGYLQASIDYGLAHRQDALQYAMQFGRGLEAALADRFVGMYVNEDTRAWNQESRRGLEHLLQQAWEQGVITTRVRPEFLPG